MPKKWPNKHETNWEVISQPKWWRFKNFVNRIRDAIWFPSNEEAWNKFPEDAKKEMLESLDQSDKVDFNKISVNKYIHTESTISYSQWDINITSLKDEVVKKDKIWEYIVIDGRKCRKWQPWITWFVYEETRSKYNKNSSLTLGFCEKWKYLPDKQAWYDSLWKKISKWNYDGGRYPDYATPSGIRDRWD